MANTINIDKFKKICERGLEESVYPFAQKYMDIFIKQFEEAHPVHKDWGRQLSHHIDLLSSTLNPESIRYDIGFQKLQDYQAMRAHVIQDGNGQIWTKPGEDVYGSDLKDKHLSTAQLAYRIPNLQHDGQHVVQNAITIGKSQAQNWREQAMGSLIYYIIDNMDECIEKRG